MGLNFPFLKTTHEAAKCLCLGTSQQNNNQKSFAILGNALVHALLVHLFHLNNKPKTNSYLVETIYKTKMPIELVVFTHTLQTTSYSSIKRKRLGKKTQKES